VQLFNLKEVSGEQHDLSQTAPDKVNQLRGMLHAWRDDVAARMMEPNPSYDPAGVPK